MLMILRELVLSLQVFFAFPDKVVDNNSFPVSMSLRVRQNNPKLLTGTYKVMHPSLSCDLS